MAAAMNSVYSILPKAAARSERFLVWDIQKTSGFLGCGLFFFFFLGTQRTSQKVEFKRFWGVFVCLVGKNLQKTRLKLSSLFPVVSSMGAYKRKVKLEHFKIAARKANLVSLGLENFSAQSKELVYSLLQLKCKSLKLPQTTHKNKRL